MANAQILKEPLKELFTDFRKAQQELFDSFSQKIENTISSFLEKVTSDFEKNIFNGYKTPDFSIRNTEFTNEKSNLGTNLNTFHERLQLFSRLSTIPP